jgi:predicted nuclease of restriction endonuclease-like RecB superfamily
MAPPQLRACLFTQAVALAEELSREEILQRVASELGLTPEGLERNLYADLPLARLLQPLAQSPSPVELIERYNLAMVQGLLLRTESLRLTLEGQAKSVIRFARLQKLLCQVHRVEGDQFELHLSGPLALFHHTTKYGRAMAAWLPVVIRASRWHLWAQCVLHQERYTWEGTYHDPIGTTHAPVRCFDSKLEEKFFRDFIRIAPQWQIRRESMAVQIGKRIVCPDFTLIEPQQQRQIPLEIVGYWTPEYLRDKLALLSQLPSMTPWVICLDEQLAVQCARPLPQAPIFYFRRSIDVKKLLTFIKTHLAAGRFFPLRDQRMTTQPPPYRYGN